MLLGVAYACLITVKYQIKQASVPEVCAVHAVLSFEVKALFVWHVQVNKLSDGV